MRLHGIRQIFFRSPGIFAVHIIGDLNLSLIYFHGHRVDAGILFCIRSFRQRGQLTDLTHCVQRFIIFPEFISELGKCHTADLEIVNISGFIIERHINILDCVRIQCVVNYCVLRQHSCSGIFRTIEVDGFCHRTIITMPPIVLFFDQSLVVQFQCRNPHICVFLEAIITVFRFSCDKESFHREDLLCKSFRNHHAAMTLCIDNENAVSPFSAMFDRAPRRILRLAPVIFAPEFTLSFIKTIEACSVDPHHFISLLQYAVITIGNISGIIRIDSTDMILGIINPVKNVFCCDVLPGINHRTDFSCCLRPSKAIVAGVIFCPNPNTLRTIGNIRHIRSTMTAFTVFDFQELRKRLVVRSLRQIVFLNAEFSAGESAAAHQIFTEILGVSLLCLLCGVFKVATSSNFFDRLSCIMCSGIEDLCSGFTAIADLNRQIIVITRTVEKFSDCFDCFSVCFRIITVLRLIMIYEAVLHRE